MIDEQGASICEWVCPACHDSILVIFSDDEIVEFVDEELIESG